MTSRIWTQYALIAPELACCLLLSTIAASPSMAEAGTAKVFDLQHHAIGETGEFNYLGVDVDIIPERGGPAGIPGFWVTIKYDDPVVGNDTPVDVLRDAFIRASCPPSSLQTSTDPYTWFNKRGTGFAVTFEQRCQEVEAGRLLPFLELRLWCSDPEKEERHLQILRGGNVFDIWPTGHSKQVKTEAYEPLVYSQRAYFLVSTVMTVLDVVAVTRGTLKASKFVVKTVLGKGVDEVVDAGFEYLKDEYGYKANFQHTGWQVRCQLCGETFHRPSLADGELMRCPRADCEGEAHLSFR